MTYETVSLDDHNKKMSEKHYEEQQMELQNIQKPTNIKCKKCDGLYRHRNYYMKYTSNPPQKLVVCVKCGDEQYIVV